MVPTEGGGIYKQLILQCEKRTSISSLFPFSNLINLFCDILATFSPCKKLLQPVLKILLHYIPTSCENDNLTDVFLFMVSLFLVELLVLFLGACWILMMLAFAVGNMAQTALNWMTFMKALIALLLAKS